jgi:hypothetical protein
VTVQILETFTEPYPHLLIADALEPQAAVRLRDWILAGDRQWIPHSEAFYDQWEQILRPSDAPIVAETLSKTVIDKLRTAVETSFGCKLDRRMRITAVRLAPGQAIGVHNDNHIDPDYRDPSGMPHERFRVLISLTPDYRDEDGGFAAIMEGPYEDSKIARLIRPIFNAGYAFKQTAKSYHAVTETRNRDRLMLVCYLYPEFE